MKFSSIGLYKYNRIVQSAPFHFFSMGLRKLKFPPVLLIALLNLVYSHGLFAATITFSATASSGVVFADASGVALPDGSLIRIGTFDLGVGDANRMTIETSNQFGVVDALFTPLAEGITNAGAISQAGNAGNVLIANAGTIGQATGSVFGLVSNWTASYMPTGTQVFIWAFNSATTFEDATEWGIFTSTNVLWLSPDPDSLTNRFMLGTQIDDALRGSIETAPSPDQLRLAMIPEPSGALLILVSALFGLRRRK